ncbi:MAG: hypothetical protein V4616_02255 [Bacteroidota bacterium]
MKSSLALLATFVALYAYPQLREFNDTTWQFRKAGTSEWKPAGKKIDLFAAFRLTLPTADPKYGGNDSLNTAVETADWEFHKVFRVTDTRYFGQLVLEGVDTYADIYLNDQLLVQCNNAFRSYATDVSKSIKKGSNELKVVFHSPITRDLPKAVAVPLLYPADSDTHPKKTSVFTRKPLLHFGWDLAPRRINCGIRSLEFELQRDFRILSYHIDPAKSDGSRKAIVELDAFRSSTIYLIVSVDKAVVTSTQPLKKGINMLSVDLPRTDSKPWSVTGELPRLNEISIRCSDRRSVNTVFTSTAQRRIRLDRGNDATGQRFTFVLNEQPFFAKGFNYIQNESSITESEVKTWKTAGVNMIRVWGGASYGDEELYRLCDKYGILIWQDFMFANTMYPGDRDFIENVKREAIDQIKRIRNHPSHAIWCGNNETAVAWKNWGWQSKYNYTEADSLKLITDYQALFDSILPALIDSLDPGKPYLSSSPVSNWGTPEDFTIGDNHYWGVYHGDQPITAYNEHIPRFASEFGMQSYPDIETLREFIPADSLVMESAAVSRLQHSYKGNKVLLHYQQENTGKPEDLEDFIYKSQVVQAEAMKTAVEAHRRNMDRCSGSLVWSWNDAAAAASWSVTDVTGRKKAACYAALNAFSDVLVSAVINNGKLEIWLISDRSENELNVQLNLKNFLNGTLKSRSFLVKKIENQSRLIYSVPLAEFLETNDPRTVWLEMTVHAENGVDEVNRNRFYFAPLGELSLPDPMLHYQLGEKGILLTWQHHAPYLQIHLAGEVYFPALELQSIWLPFDHKLASGIRARSLNQTSVRIHH